MVWGDTACAPSLRSLAIAPAQGFYLAFVEFGGELQQLLLIFFNRGVPADFAPLFFQSIRQRIPLDPRRRERIAAIPGHSEGLVSHAASPWVKPESGERRGLHSVLARTRNPRSASSSACASSMQPESSRLSSAIRCWMAFFASSIRCR